MTGRHTNVADPLASQTDPRHEPEAELRDGSAGTVEAEALPMPDAGPPAEPGVDTPLASRLLRALVDTMPIGVIVSSTTGAILTTNAVAEDILGSSVLGSARRPERSYTPLHPDGSPFPADEMPLVRALERGEITQGVELLIRRADGAQRTILAGAAPIYDEHGTMAAAITVFQDVSEHRETREGLRVALEKYRVLFESFPLGITISDALGQIVETNREAERLLGVPHTEHTQRHIDGREWRIVRPDGSPMPPEEWASVQALREDRLIENVEMGIVKGAGDVTWISVTAAPIPLEGYGVAIAYGDVTARRQAEEALRASEERFRSLYWSMTEGVALHEIVADSAGRAVDYVLLDVNPAYEEITGLSRTQVVGRRASDLYGTGMPPYIELYAKVAASGESTSFEAYFAPMEKRFRISVFSPGSGRFATVFEDITERKRAEEERARLVAQLDQERNMLRTIMASTQTHLAYLDPQFNFIHVNQAYAEGAGYSQEELLGRNHFDLFPHAENRAIFERIRDTGEPGGFIARPFEHPARSDLGVTYWDWTLVPVKDAAGQVHGLVLSLADVTDRERQREVLERHADLLEAEVERRTAALRASEERFRAVFESAGLGIALVDAQGRILSANPALQEMLGMEEDAVLGQQLVNLDDPAGADGDQARPFAALVAGDRDVYRCQRRYERPNGDPIWVNLTVSGVRDREAGLQYAIVMMENVTEQKEAQEALLRTEKLASAGRLAASLTHEINNPLQTVIGCLGLAQESLAHDEDAGELLELAAQELKRAAGIVAQLRDVGRVSTPSQRERVDVNTLLDQVLVLIKPRCQERQVELVWHTPDGLPALRLSSDRMRQVFLNLALNAIDAMPDGGRLAVTSDHVPERDAVRILFSDTGHGIEPEHLSRLFEPFYTTKSEGLGLGLYITNTIVEEHGGQIEVTSHLGEGTALTVWLPV